MARSARTIAATALLASATAVYAADDPTQGITVGTKQVADDLYMLNGEGGFAGGNVAALTGTDGLLIIDDQIPGMSEKLAGALDDLAGERPRYVINTHWHFDHTGGNVAFGDDATILAHENARETMAEPQQIEALGRNVPATDEIGLPEITFNDALTLHFNGREIRVRHYPNGHTSGDAVVYFPEVNVLHAGDHLFVDRFPFIDLEHGGDVEQYTRNIADILETYPDDATVIPGHGPLADMAALERAHAMLEATTATVREGIEAGKSLEEIRSEGLADQWSDWSWAVIDEAAWINTVHASLTR